MSPRTRTWQLWRWRTTGSEDMVQPKEDETRWEYRGRHNLFGWSNRNGPKRNLTPESSVEANESSAACVKLEKMTGKNWVTD